MRLGEKLPDLVSGSEQLAACGDTWHVSVKF
jgi:hypothetical protein